MSSNQLCCELAIWFNSHSSLLVGVERVRVDLEDVWVVAALVHFDLGLELLECAGALRSPIRELSLCHGQLSWHGQSWSVATCA